MLATTVTGFRDPLLKIVAKQGRLHLAKSLFYLQELTSDLFLNLPTESQDGYLPVCKNLYGGFGFFVGFFFLIFGMFFFVSVYVEVED